MPRQAGIAAPRSFGLAAVLMARPRRPRCQSRKRADVDRLGIRRVFLVPLALLPFALVPAAVLLGSLWAVPASASTVPAPGALVTSASASPSSVPASGGTVTVTGTVLHATSCQLELLSSQSFPVVYSHNSRSCTSGTFSAKVTVGPNPTLVARTVAFALVASNSSSSYPGHFYISLAPAPSVLVMSASASPSSVPASGGTVTVTGTVLHATSCQLELLSSQSFPVVYSHNSRGCTSGTFSAKVTIGPNPTDLRRTVALALVVHNQASSSTAHFYVTLAAAPPSTTSAAPPATTVVPSTSPPVSLAVTNSSNWSGYSAIGGPYAEIKGTFTVPSVLSGVPANAQVSEWVGLDGTSASDSSLIQAGVDEYPDVRSPQGYDVQAWWEILPAAETNITMTVNAGDKVTVAIWKVSSGAWKINVTDDTTGASFTTPNETYSGPGTSAEWIVEATTECQAQSNCHTASLAPYTPAVAFSGLGMMGPQATSVNDIVLVQGFNDVATPSPLTDGGFTVPYTGPSTATSGI